jgi:DNA-directed RNA polymerase beta subunit
MNMVLTHPEKISKIRQWLNQTELDPLITKTTIGISATQISPQVLLASSEKLIRINKGNDSPDDRDNLKYSRFMGVEDFVEEHINRDAGHIQQKAAYKMQMKKNLSWLTPGFFSPQIRSVIIGNTLANNVDGINPLEHWDNSHKVTKMGPGGIPSTEAIPTESRNVAPSSFGFFDPVHISETEKIGVNNYVAHNVGKGDDGKLYKVMKTKDGLKWMNHEDILNQQVLIPEY